MSLLTRSLFRRSTRRRSNALGRRPPAAATPSGVPSWTRRKLQAVVLLASALGLALVGGAALFTMALLRDTPPSDIGPFVGSTGPHGVDDDRSEAKFGGHPLADALPGPLATRTTSSIVLPASEQLGTADVPTGFPPTSAGALAQLIAIDRAAIEPAVVSHAQDVITAWSAPGGPTAENWSGVAAVAGLLGAAGLPASGTPELHLSLEPAMGFFQTESGSHDDGDDGGDDGSDDGSDDGGDDGSDGGVLACVDFLATATITAATTGTTTSSGAPSGIGSVNRIAVADCQRMVWRKDRWIIAPGPEPAQAPSLWPGTEEAIDAGYRWLETPPWHE